MYLIAINHGIPIIKLANMTMMQVIIIINIAISNLVIILIFAQEKDGAD